MPDSAREDQMTNQQRLKNAQQIQTAADELVKRHRAHFEGWIVTQQIPSDRQVSDRQPSDAHQKAVTKPPSR
jgi:hypothetical protein